MIIVIIVIVVLVLGIGGIIALSKKKKQCTCIGKTCGSDDGCGNQCCDESKGQECGTDGKCCDKSCHGSCSGTNGCGESCAKIVCGDEPCFQGNCCTQDCTVGSCNKSCGVPCPCPNETDVCNTTTGKCCTPDDCSTGICGNDPECGEKCTCQNDYCPGDGCCVEGKCSYKNICNVEKNGDFALYLQEWAQFCKPGPLPTKSQCLNCNLENAIFTNDGTEKSVAPISGTISCDQCWNGTKYVNADPVVINPAVNYYNVVDGKITAGTIDEDKCVGQPGGCAKCTCLTSADCKRWGCDDHECIGMYCTKSS